ncbi:FHA domain-containing protein, partial [Microbacterium sp. zg-YB36]|uniref:FHA domain-containing protein n=1 Tax=Microbacterium sp. zg-YB36 TaxID=2969407 RepID=UPI00214AC9BF
APPPPPAPPSPTAPVPTAADAVFAPPTAGPDAQPASGPVPWTPAADAAARPAVADEGFDARWASGLDEVSAISQPPQGAPVAARPVATGLPALAEDGATGPERGRTGEAAPSAAIAPPVLAEPAHPVPLRTAPVDIDPSLPAVTRAPAGAPRAARAVDPEFPLDTADEVSAVAGAPVAGAPRSALSAVAGTDATSVDEDFPDQTVVARRRRVMWTLQPASGAPIDLTADVVILGRQPASDPAYRTAQLVAIADDTRTVSKTHARLELRGERWIVTDLGSTNGVMLPTLMGTEIEADPGAELAPGERFLLGDVAFRLVRVEG